MESLRQRDARRLLGYLRDLYAPRDYDAFTAHLVSTLSALVPADLYSCNEVDTRRKYAAACMSPREFLLLPDALAILGRYAHQHPTLAHWRKTGDGRPRRMTDFLSTDRLGRLGIYREFYRPNKIPHNIVLAGSPPGHRSVWIGVHREGKNFSDSACASLALLRPHLIQALANAQAVTRMQEELAVAQVAVEQLDQAIVSLGATGHIQWATPQGQRLLEYYGLIGSRPRNWISEKLRGWLRECEARLNKSDDAPTPITPLLVERHGKSIAIRFVRERTQRLLLIEDRSSAPSPAVLAPYGLSRRETEVLSWVAQGKSNPEIGTILGISRRTVQKHLERTYTKLGVEHRHAAIALVLQERTQ